MGHALSRRTGTGTEVPKDASVSEPAVAEMARALPATPLVPLAEGGALSEEQLASVGLSREMIERFRVGEECTFWFVKAGHLRTLTPAALPRMQELRRDGWLVQRRIRFVDVCMGAYRRKHLVVSHRWEAPGVPDGLGVQAQAVQEYLQRHPGIELVWYDYSCMPQGEKTALEQVELRAMLPNINLLYLGCAVLIIQDLSYLSRFW